MTEDQTQKPWISRITGHGEEAPDQLLANPQNFRRHPKNQQRAMGAVLDDVGVIQSVIVNRQTGHLIDGHLRVELALRRNEPTVPVTYVDLSPDDEAKALATFDPLGNLAYADLNSLASLRSGVDFNDPDVNAMLDDLVSFASPTPALDDDGSRPEFPEYDESAGDDVQYITCPHCGESFPR